MALQDANDETEIRKHYRDVRDRLKGTSARLDMVSKATIRPEMSALFGGQSEICNWLMVVFDELEKLRLDIVNLNSEGERIIGVLEKIRAWQGMYEPSLDVMKKEYDKVKNALETNDHNGTNKKKGNH